MDLSAVIFVALAVAWAVYLVPKALKHHDEVARTRSVDRFSATMRTLARREPAPASTGGRVVVTPGRPAPTTQVTTKPRSAATAVAEVSVPAPVELTPAQRRRRREAARAAARRRRRVLGALLVALVASLVTAGVGAASWWLVAVPGSLIVMWLVACRAMVRGERRGRVAAPVAVTGTGTAEVDGAPVDVRVEDEVADYPSSYDVLRTEEGFDEPAPEAQTASIDAAEVDPELWEPRPVTLPTYVHKDIAPLMHAKLMHKNDDGVWTSGHDTSDSIMAQTGRDAEREARSENGPAASSDATRDPRRWDGGRAVGS
ncbi:hypothetical protein GCM10009737_23620 [Nocardioides lentus]|uniref:DUF2207 domain-containing protein n=1 Tax=Nocardioides lentus TaxID=338077 RepID=A0ABP5AS98_9ACTN